MDRFFVYYWRRAGLGSLMVMHDTPEYGHAGNQDICFTPESKVAEVDKRRCIMDQV